MSGFQMLGAGMATCDLRLPYTGTLFPFDVMKKGCAGGGRKVEIIFMRTINLPDGKCWVIHFIVPFF